jgi:acyl carrier protein
MVMQEDEIFSVLAKIIEKVAEVPESSVTPEADITDDLGISSLSMVEIVVSAEDKFNVEIPDEDLEDFRTVQDVVSYVRRAHSAQASA